MVGMREMERVINYDWFHIYFGFSIHFYNKKINIMGLFSLATCFGLSLSAF
jgi:hypothetical protein